MSQTIYLQVGPEAGLAEISELAPFRAVILVDTQVSSEWQSTVSEWLVRSGCRYAMAWGVSSSAWDDAVDMANIEQFEFNEIPEDRFVMTTWHEDETLDEVFWYCKNCAFHPKIDLRNTLLLHISTQDRGEELERSYAEA